MNGPVFRRFASLALLLVVVWGGTQALQAWSRQRLGADVAAHAKPGDIAMISSLTCLYCAAAREWFTEYRVPFAECFIESDAACDAKFNTLLSPGTPVLLVRGQRQVGFDAQRVAKALQQPGDLR
jgi:glutaredoxin